MNECKLRWRMGFALGCTLASACGTVAVKVPMMKPAEVNMAGYQSIAIGGLTEYNQHTHYYWWSVDPSRLHPMTGMLEEALVATNRFQVVDRSHLDGILREQKLGATDLAAEGSVSKLGKVITAGALIFGEVQDTYKESKKREKCSVLFDKKQHVCNSITGEFRVVAHLKVVDVSTGQLKVTKNLEDTASDTNTGTDEPASPIDRPALEKKAREQVIAAFMKSIAPYQVVVEARFQTDGDIAQFETGIVWAKRGEWAKAIDIFNAAAQEAEKNTKLKSGQVAKCYWNLGLAYEYSGQYDKAVDLINKAFTMSNNPDVLNELDNVKKLRADAEKLQAQNAAAPGTN